MKMSEHHGHRMRMIEKIETNTLREHEYLEILLFNGLPRKNTNELAHRLLSRFGTVYNLFCAPMSAVAEVDGVGIGIAGYIKTVGVLTQKYIENVKNASNYYKGLYEREKFFLYLTEHFKEEPIEVFEVYFLNEKRNVICYYKFEGESNHSVTFEPKQFAKLLVSVAPAGVVVAHNHPLGTAMPSAMDDENTERCRLLCNVHNVMFCDHIVCGADGCYSYYDHGKINTNQDV